MSGGPIMIMAGGTGGHVFPGLAVAAELKARQREVVWLGTHRGLEARLVPQHGIEIEWITIAGVRGRGVWAWLSAPFRVLAAVVEALRALNRRRPAAVLGMGGFVAGPGGFAAWLTRRPLLIHEQNSVAGTTNRLLAPFAARVFEAFPGSFPARAHAELVGNPVRRSLMAAESPRQRLSARSTQRRRVLVIRHSRSCRLPVDPRFGTRPAAVLPLRARLTPRPVSTRAWTSSSTTWARRINGPISS
jgi:UDP-N-acetylglucosamine--N-acetylmuramyl-(pentapeptide) pyrophosphoryl-undecaprenol N-acetylglucosamine transferase